jgi:hypothetical protein
VRVGQLGAGGATTFSFDRGEVSGWNMNIQGTLERVLDSVLPHEVSHTIFACHFRRPLPRWADEGAATLVEHETERMRQQQLVRQILNSNRPIPLRSLLSMTEYPTNMQDVMTLYAEGYALCDLLVQRGGRSRYLSFLTAGHKQGWDRALKSHYGFQSVDALESEWKEWIMAGCPAQVAPEGQLLAGKASPRAAAAKQSPALVARSQSPDDEAPLMSPRSRPSSTPRVHREPLGQGLEAPSPQRSRAGQAAIASPVELGESQSFASVQDEPDEAAAGRGDDEGWVPTAESRHNSGAARPALKSGFSMPVRANPQPRAARAR